MGEIKEKGNFHTRAGMLYGKYSTVVGKYSIDGQTRARGVKNLIKGGITVDCVNNTSINNKL